MRRTDSVIREKAILMRISTGSIPSAWRVDLTLPFAAAGVELVIVNVLLSVMTGRPS